MLTSLLCGLATSVAMLTLFRLLQGISAACMVPTSLALINQLFDDNRERAKAIGIWGATGGVAAATGPILGAVLTTLLTWRAVFWVNLLFGGLCLFLTVTSIATTVATKSLRQAFDWLGLGLAVVAIAALALGLIEVGRLGIQSPWVFGALLVFIVALLGFIMTERRAVAPMLPLSLFKRAHFSAAVLVGLLINLGFYGELFVLPLYFQTIRHDSVMITGFSLLPLMITIALSSYLSGKLASHIGPKWPMSIGLGVGTLGFLGLQLVGYPMIPYVYLIVPLILAGFGMAFTMPAATLVMMRSVSLRESGIAAAAFNSSRQVGSMAGVALFGSVIAAASHFISAMQVTLLLATVAFLLAWGISACWVQSG